jgi:hypothetical protein
VAAKKVPTSSLAKTRTGKTRSLFDDENGFAVIRRNDGTRTITGNIDRAHTFVGIEGRHDMQWVTGDDR